MNFVKRVSFGALTGYLLRLAYRHGVSLPRLLVQY